MEWGRDKTADFERYVIKKVFNSTIYIMWVYVEESPKSIKFHIGVSSGKKRKELDYFDLQDRESKGGLRALFWLKSAMYDFPCWYSNKWNENKNKYICIGWADNRRRNIYERLCKEGFQFMVDDGEKILIKKL